MDQFGKFQRISSSFDPENPLMDVGNDSGILTHLNGQLVQWLIGTIGRYQITDAVKSVIVNSELF